MGQAGSQDPEGAFRAFDRLAQLHEVPTLVPAQGVLDSAEDGADGTVGSPHLVEGADGIFGDVVAQSVEFAVAFVEVEKDFAGEGLASATCIFAGQAQRFRTETGLSSSSKSQWT